ncbi:GNAT family N-acetyltransferase [Deinococcus pimensis]|uniref:GNAT family N-acetyltransferase n=1 Tax=Deinococcus pimensis TaxID=309888 RepID=UPI00048366D0|nr:GNAT family N-acetyltransferase [Deinococcus pimensis]
MDLHSLGFRTDAMLIAFDGVVRDLGDAVKVTNPNNPGHFFGNFLVFDRPPRAGDLAGWEARFASEVGAPPLTRHVLLGWDTNTREQPDLTEFLAAGYALEENLVMATRDLHPPKRPNREAEFRPIRDDDDEWAQVLECQIATKEDRWDAEQYRVFKTQQMRRYRAMTRAGMGHWYGAFVDGELAADLGVFVVDGLARYQSVGTLPKFRRRGLCGTLTHLAGEHARETLGARDFVIVADDHYFAKDVYADVGFRPYERQQMLLRTEPGAG